MTNNKIARGIPAFVFGLALAALILACKTPVSEGGGSGGDDKTENTYTACTITFDTGDGSGTAPSSQTRAAGDVMYLPGKGTMVSPAGKNFAGWKTGGQNYTAGDSFTVTAPAVFIAQWAASGEYAQSLTTVQKKLDRAVTSQAPASAKFVYADYNTDKGYIVLTYKLGVIKGMFLQYITQPHLVTSGLEKYTYSVTNSLSVSKQVSIMNSIAVSVSAKVKAGVEFGPASVSAEYGLSAEARTSAEYTNVITELTKETESFTYDMSGFPAGKSFAMAAFGDIEVYQAMQYNPQTKTATPIAGKSLWFCLEPAKPVRTGLYVEDVTDLELPQTLQPFELISGVTVTESDFSAGLAKSYSVTKTDDLDHVSSTSRDEIYNPNLFISALKAVDYTKLKIEVSFRYRAENLLGGKLRLQINDYNKANELGSKDWTNLIGDAVWHDGSWSITVDIDKTHSTTGQIMLLWSKAGISEYCIGRRTVIITALR